MENLSCNSSEKSGRGPYVGINWSLAVSTASQLLRKYTGTMLLSRRTMDVTAIQSATCALSSQSFPREISTSSRKDARRCFSWSRTMADELSILSQKYIPRISAACTKNGWIAAPEVSPRNRACCFSEVKRIPNLFSRHKVFNRLIKMELAPSKSENSRYIQLHAQLLQGYIRKLESSSSQRR